MKLIVGLGNPGIQYSGTRHNIGRRCVESLAKQFALKFSKSKTCEAFSVEFVHEGETAILAYPDNYMNVSGVSVDRLCQHHGIVFQQELLVLVDDVALPFGCLRMRSCGSDGGHNGLKSIQMHLGSSHYARLRIGIGSGNTDEGAKTNVQKEMSLEDFVLAPFPAGQENQVGPLMAEAGKACLLWMKQPIEKVMNSINRCVKKT